MKPSSVTPVVLLAALLAGSAAGQTITKPGETVPDFAFEKIAVPVDGTFQMKQWLGRPVLFEFWGTR